MAHKIRSCTDDILRKYNITDTYESRKVFFTEFLNSLEELKKIQQPQA